MIGRDRSRMVLLQRVAMCDGVWRCVAMCCGVLQFAGRLFWIDKAHMVLQCTAVFAVACCSVLQCLAVSCRARALLNGYGVARISRLLKITSLFRRI